MNVTRGVHVAEAPRLDREVGGLEQDREVGRAGELRALEEVGQRAELGGQLLLPEQEQRHVDRTGVGERELADELDGDRNATLHVGRAAAVHGAVRDPARHVVLGRDGVVVADEQHERHAGAPRAGEDERVLGLVLGRKGRGNQAAEVRAHLGLVQALRWDVDQLERPLGQTLRQRFHEASVPAYSGHHPPHRHPGRARAREGAPAGRAPERGRHGG